MWIAIGIVAVVMSLVITILLNRKWVVRERGFNIKTEDVVLFVAMMLGALGRELYSMLLNKASFNWISLAMAVIVSPIVFAAVHKSGNDVPVDLIRLCLAFQNGFFWNSIFESIQPSGGG
jgi:hypothetical protein